MTDLCVKVAGQIGCSLVTVAARRAWRAVWAFLIIVPVPGIGDGRFGAGAGLVFGSEKMGRAAVRAMTRQVRDAAAAFGDDFGSAVQRQAVYDRVSQDLVQVGGAPLTKRQAAMLARFVAYLPVQPVPASARRMARVSAGIAVVYGVLLLLNLVLIWGAALPAVAAWILTLFVGLFGVSFVVAGVSLWRRVDGAQLSAMMMMAFIVSLMSLRALLSVGPFALVSLALLLVMLFTARAARRAVCSPVTFFGKVVQDPSTGQWRF